MVKTKVQIVKPNMVRSADLSACKAPDNVSVDNNWMPGINGRLIAMGKVNGIVNRIVNRIVNAVRSMIPTGG